MVLFDDELTEIIFLDTEFYVPPEDRDRPGASLLANPYKENHFFLGGVFRRHFPLKPRSSDDESRHFWIWRLENEENVLRLIYEMFQRSWERLKDKDPMQADLIVSGIGISRFDLPMLFIRSLKYHFASPEELFECYFKLKQVDLSNVGIGFFTLGVDVFYPKTANQLLRRFGIRKEKLSGMNVWQLYDNGDFRKIELRTDEEVCDCVEIYRRMKRHLSHRARKKA